MSSAKPLGSRYPLSHLLASYLHDEATMPEKVNQHELRVIGMSRSGNHPIINWIRRQTRGRVCFLNCAEPQTCPFNTCRPLASGRRAIANYRPFRLREEQQGNFSPKDWLIYSYEDCFLTMIDYEKFERHHDDFVGSSAQRLNVLILRDPLNLFASRLQAGFGGVTPKTAVRIWKQHARQFVGKRNYLSQPLITVSYNEWSRSRQYREDVASQLGLRFSDRGFRQVAATGGGSSFDGRNYQGRADAMPTLDRWRTMRDDPKYTQLFDHQMLELAIEAFQLPPDAEESLAELAEAANT